MLITPSIKAPKQVKLPFEVEKLDECIPEQYNKEEQVLYKPYKSSDIYCGKIININNDSQYLPYLIQIDNDSIWATPMQLYKYNI